MRLDVLDRKRFMIWLEPVERIQRLVSLPPPPLIRFLRLLVRCVLSGPDVARVVDKRETGRRLISCVVTDSLFSSRSRGEAFDFVPAGSPIFKRESDNHGA